MPVWLPLPKTPIPEDSGRKRKEKLHMRHPPECFCEKDTVREHSAIQPMTAQGGRLHRFKENNQKKANSKREVIASVVVPMAPLIKKQQQHL